MEVRDPTTNIVTPGWITTQDLEDDAYLEPGVYCISGHKDAKLAGGDELIAIEKWGFCCILPMQDWI